MRRIDFVVTPVAGIVVVVVVALSTVVGIVAHFVSSQTSQVPAQTANGVADLERSLPRSSSNASAAIDIPTFEIVSTPVVDTSVSSEPDALIWWDAPSEPTSLPSPTAMGATVATTIQQVVYVVVTPTPPPTPMPAFSGNGQPIRQVDQAFFGVDGIVYVVTPVGEMPCSEIYLEWGGKDARAQNREYLPWFSWFESISNQQRMAYFHMCDRVVVMPRGDNG